MTTRPPSTGCREARDAVPSDRLSFGVTGITVQAEHTPRAYREAYAQTLRLAEVIEDAGFDALWTAEHHFAEDGFIPAPLVLLAALARHTDQVVLGANVVLAPLWNPIRLAEEAAVVDQVSAGRVALTFGIGYREQEFRGLGVPFADRARMLERAVDLVRAAWRGDPLNGVGDLDAHESVVVSPLPFRAGGPPIWVGGAWERPVRRARRLGDGYMAPTVDVAGLVERIGWLADERPLADFAVGTTVLAYVSATGEDAPGVLRAANPTMETNEKPAPRLPGMGRPIVVVGTPKEVVDGLSPVVGALAQVPGGNARHLNCRLTYPNVTERDNAESLRLFGEVVAPALRRVHDEVLSATAEA